jgi:hypothetical protein
MAIGGKRIGDPMAIDAALIDKLLAEYKKPEDIIGENGLLKQLTKAVLERALNAELTDHLGYEPHDPAGHNTGNSRNGMSKKKLKGDFGESIWRRRGTVMPASSLGSWPKGKRGSRGSTTRSCRCTRGG